MFLVKPEVDLPAGSRGGNKLDGLIEVRRSGAHIPATLVLEEGEDVTSEFDRLLDHLAILNQTPLWQHYIVRSSSYLEDNNVTSAAGAYLSLHSGRREIIEAITAVRLHAKNRGNPSPIPVLIQPFLPGPGGVFLYDRDLDVGRLSLAWTGASAITDGSADAWTQVDTDTEIWKTCYSDCMKVARSLAKNIDCEIVYFDSHVIFLQMRPWLGSTGLTNGRQYVADDNSDSLLEYFPTPLRPLIGELWALALSTNPSRLLVSYGDGSLKIISTDDAEPDDASISEAALKDTFLTYYRTLFPAWRSIERELDRIGLEFDERATLDSWLRAKALWIKFYSDYFYNLREPVVSKARVLAIDAGISPSVRRLLMDSGGLPVLGEYAGSDRQQSETPWIRRHGNMFVDCQYFDEPTAAESVAVMRHFVGLRGTVPIPYKKRRTLLSRVACLSSEDNFFKHRINAAFRRIIISAAKRFMPDSPDDIWLLSLESFELQLIGQVVRTQPRGQVASAGLKRGGAIRTLGGVIGSRPLTPGIVEGVVCPPGETPGPDSILLRLVITDADYPALALGRGAIVSLGSEFSHGTLIAQELGKVVHLAPMAARVLKSGDHVRLDGPRFCIVLSDGVSRD